MAEDGGYILVLVTTADKKEAGSIARALVEHKKAACVSIISGVNSLFWWRGNADSAKESLLLIKTKSDMLENITWVLIMGNKNW